MPAFDARAGKKSQQLAPEAGCERHRTIIRCHLRANYVVIGLLDEICAVPAGLVLAGRFYSEFLVGNAKWLLRHPCVTAKQRRCLAVDERIGMASATT